MAEESEAKGGVAKNDHLAALSLRLEEVMALLHRLETRIDALHEECARTASASSRVLLRQQGIAKALSRMEEDFRSK